MILSSIIYQFLSIINSFSFDFLSISFKTLSILIHFYFHFYVKLNENWLVKKRVLFTKAEHMNMTGNIKDRMAFHIIKQGYKRGILKPGYLIIEATSGNTGISFAARISFSFLWRCSS